MKEIRQHTYRIICILLQYIRQKEMETPETEINELWQRIELQVISRKRIQRQKQYLLCVVVAASIALLFVAGYIAFDFRNEAVVNQLAEYAELTKGQAEEVTNEIKLMLSDEKEMLVEENSDIVYSQGGTVLINEDTVEQRIISSKRKESINQIVTPKGKRAQLTLSDGTRMWINAGTRVVYPNTFQKNFREIFVDGEVYIEVSHNEKVPFYVKTKEFKVQVLGTKFDVSSYESESLSSVVLVDGSVKIDNQKEKGVVLIPNQLINIQNGELDTPITVDVKKYICWIDDLLVYEDEPLPILLKKLERYYGKKFLYPKGIDRYQVSGKLDLKERLEDVLHTISFSFPVRFEIEGEVVNVYIE